jgi:regulator of nonsense transcripts 2
MSEINPEETPHIPDIAEQERNEVQSYIDENNKKIQAKTAIRTLNLNCQRPSSDEYFFKLDSSLKKNTAFVKKLKQFTASQLDILLKDMKCLNLTKYISEVASAIVEVKLKMSDVHAVIELSSQLHRIYVDFSQTFIESWQKCLAVKSGDKINASKMRVDLRLFAELISAGIFTNKLGLPLLGQTLTGLISQDKEEHSNLSIVLTFCKHCGEEYAGLVPRRIQELTKKHNMQLPQSNLLPTDKQQNLRNLLRDYYQTLCRHLKGEHRDLQAAEKSKRKQMESKGEISNEKREHLEMLQNNFDKLLNSAQTLSDLLNEPLPELPREPELPTEGIILENSEESGEVQLDPWGDEETKSFYVDLPDLRQFLPNYCAPKENLALEVPQVTEEVLDEEEVDGLDTEDVDDPPSVEVDVPEPVEEAAAATTPTHSVQSHTIHDKKYLEIFLANLHDCLNKELIDSAAIDFLLTCNTKNNRKKLMKALFNVQRTRLDLFPLYSRLVAIINLVAPDVAVELGQMLKIDFKYHVKKRDQV